MKKLVAIALTAMLAGGAAFAKEVKVGVIMPMSGAFGGYGQPSWEGVKLAHEMIGGKLDDGTEVKLVLIDNKSDKIETATAMQKLISSEKVTAVVGALTSSNTLAITEKADSSQTPMVAPVATNPRVTKNRDYVSRVCFSDDFQGVVAANFAYNDIKARKVAIIVDTKSDYSIGLAKSFERQFQKNGGKIAKKTLITGGDKDFTAQLSAIKTADADMVYIPLYTNETVLIALQANQLGLKVPFIGGDGIAADKLFFEAGGQAVQGFMETNYYSTESKQTPRGEKFTEMYKAKFNEKVHTFSAMSADAFNVIIEAMNNCKDPFDSVCVNKNIRMTKDFAGVSGMISLDPQGNAVRSAVINETKGDAMVYRATVNP